MDRYIDQDRTGSSVLQVRYKFVLNNSEVLIHTIAVIAVSVGAKRRTFITTLAPVTRILQMYLQSVRQGELAVGG